MNKAKLITASAIILVVSAGILLLQKNTQHNSLKNDSAEQQNYSLKKDNAADNYLNVEGNKFLADRKTKNDKALKSDKSNTTSSSSEIIHKKINLYSDVPSTALPLSAITLMPDISDNIKEELNSVYENSNILMANKSHDKILLITDNSSNIRLGIDFTEISLKNGHKTNTTLGYSGKTKDFSNEIWDYDKDTGKPLRHTTYDEAGDVIFVETWNYSPDNPVKYQMKDADGNTLSMRKETLENGSDLRVENIVYDKEGNTKISVSSTYDGADIKRFTYYNSDKPSDSGSVFSEYDEGLKTKEILYTSDLKVKNTITSNYADGVRESITVYDPENNEVEKLSAE